MPRLWLDASAQSVCNSPITAAQTTIVLTSTANFGAPSAAFPLDVVMLDAGNPAYSATNPFATPFEYQQITGNVMGTNTLTINGGVRSSYAGTTPQAFFTGAIVAATWLAEGINASLPQTIGSQKLSGLATAFPSIAIPSTPVFGVIKVYGYVQGNGATVDIGVQFNADSAANYSMTQLFATSATPQSTGPAVSTSALLAQAASGSSVTFEATIVAPSVTTLTNRPIIAHSSTQGEVIIRGSYWNQSSALTSLVVTSSGNMIANSYITVVGYPV